MTQPATPPSQPAPIPVTNAMNLHTVASVLETIGFVVAVILQVIHDPHFAGVAALAGASFHAYNH